MITTQPEVGLINSTTGCGSKKLQGLSGIAV